MSDPGTFWLAVVNIALAGVIVTCLAAIGVVFVREIVQRVTKRRALYNELDQDMADLFGHLSGAGHTPLQLTRSSAGAPDEQWRTTKAPPSSR
jgi:membrane protein implicated in regulation of membrane protease activity